MTQYSSKNQKIWLTGFCLIIIFNIIQATFTELHPDEAYYWMYAQFLDWGYFDHPPMVALYIKLGTLLGNNEFHVRLLSIVSSAIALTFLWKLLHKMMPKNVNAIHFFLLYLNFTLFQVYGFITTPDTPLLLGTVLFYYILYDYLRNDSLKNTFSLSLVIVFMLYSKYHVILLLLITIIAEPKFFLRKSFYYIIAFSVLGYVPHLWWQFKNNFPTLHYHLFDRNQNAPYQYIFTSNYVLAQILFGGVFIFYWVYSSIFKRKTENAFERILWWNCIGLFIFFFLSTFRGPVEAHWTLIAFVPLFILSYQHLTEKDYFQHKFFQILGLTSIVGVLLLRCILIFPFNVFKKTPAVQLFHNNKTWAQALYKQTNGEFCLIDDGFQKASYYNFYNQTVSASSYNAKFYRKTQYDFWDIQQKFPNQKPIYFSEHKNEHLLQSSLPTPKGIWYFDTLNSTHIFNKINITFIQPPTTLTIGRPYLSKVIIENPYPLAYKIDSAQNWEINIKDQNGLWKTIPLLFKHHTTFAAQSILEDTLSFDLPSKVSTGNYVYFISLQNNHLSGTRNSNFNKIKIQ